MPSSRILHSSNIHIPLNPTDTAASAVFTSSDSVNTSASPENKYEGSFDGFSFEWDGVSEDGDSYGLAGDLGNKDSEADEENFPSTEHVPTLLNAIEEVSEEDDLRRSLTTTATTDDSTVPRAQTQTQISLDAGSNADIRRGGIGERILERYRKLGSRPACITPPLTEQSAPQQRRARNKLRKKARPPVAITGDPASSLSLSLCPRPSRISVSSIPTTAYPFCRPTSMFSLRKLSWRSAPTVRQTGASDDVQAVAAGVVTELWGGSDLRLCRRHRLNGVTP